MAENHQTFLCQIALMYNESEGADIMAYDYAHDSVP